MSLTLYHHSWQLLVVTYHDELVYGTFSFTVCSRKDSQQMWFQYLRGLVDDGNIEVFQLEEGIELRANTRHCAHNDAMIYEKASDLVSVSAVDCQVLHQMRTEL